MHAVVAPVVRTILGGVDATVHDASGRLQTVRYRASTAEEKVIVQRITRRLLPPASRHHRAQDWTLGLITLAMLINVIGMSLISGIKHPAAYGIPVAALAAMWALRWRRQHHIPIKFNARLVASAWMAEGRCPTCGYELSPEGLRGHSSTQVTCTECGARWHPR